MVILNEVKHKRDGRSGSRPIVRHVAAFVICSLQVNGHETQSQRKIKGSCRELGYEAVVICTPEELMEV
jgi:hypothetical protein